MFRIQLLVIVAVTVALLGESAHAQFSPPQGGLTDAQRQLANSLRKPQGPPQPSGGSTLRVDPNDNHLVGFDDDVLGLSTYIGLQGGVMKKIKLKTPPKITVRSTNVTLNGRLFGPNIWGDWGTKKTLVFKSAVRVGDAVVGPAWFNPGDLTADMVIQLDQRDPRNDDSTTYPVFKQIGDSATGAYNWIKFRVYRNQIFLDPADNSYRIFDPNGTAKLDWVGDEFGVTVGDKILTKGFFFQEDGGSFVKRVGTDWVPGDARGRLAPGSKPVPAPPSPGLK